MKTIKFFHPEETFVYHIDKCFCKVVYSGEQYQLLVEIQSTDNLDHVEDDALQNDFPQVVLTVDDFPVPYKNTEELAGKIIEIPESYVEIDDEEEGNTEFYYTNVNFSDDDYEADKNSLSFFRNETGALCLKWKGKVQNFTNDSDNYIRFEAECSFSDFQEDDMD